MDQGRCKIPPIPVLLLSKEFLPDTDSIRLTFSEKVENTKNLKQQLIVTLKKIDQGPEESSADLRVEVTGHTDSSSEQTIVLWLTLEGEVENGELLITKAPQSYSEIVFASKEDVSRKFSDYPIRIPGVSFYKFGVKASQISASTLKTSALVSGGLVAYLSP